MLFVIPTATDAPSYHFPFATIGMIALNTIVLVLQLAFPEAAEFFILRHAILNPITWFSSCCMHADFCHLLGNMVGLAICGWIIEGKVGWWKFILIYFAIGVSANAFEHAMMFWVSNGGSLGASGVIFGMLAIIMIWAPENEITFSYGGLLLFYPVAGSFSVTVMGFCFYMIGVEFLIAWFSFFEMSSALLHLMGVVPGALIGYFMVKQRLVDCEGYDLMSVQSGNSGKRVLTIAQEREVIQARKRARAEARSQEQHGLERAAAYVAEGHHEFAWKRFEMLRRKNASLVMSEAQLVAIINGLNSDASTRPKAIDVMRFYLKHYSNFRVPITINLARHTLSSLDRPRECIRIMRTIDGEQIAGKHLKAAEAVLKKAREKIAQGAIDFV
ncbi:rhomboid family intramembrane serine protease [Mariniblastus fucicola]|uniref:Rhomboid family protein n=1 Tax=Mariniblastus fucicola TaxID=980251 RepID=A0A5B9PAX6_9BACT|nr:rhomboid family intramembrane serine protease [Mariniblastus fucicola]QEG23877.1 Rhomboid family protein [Mariniblastus fucicola]